MTLSCIRRKRLEIDPNSRLVDMGMGVVYANRGEYEKAIQRFQRLAEEYPESATIRFWKSFVHLAMNQPGLAVQEAEKASSLEDSTFLKLNLAWICAETGDKVRARKILDEVMKGKLDDYVRPSEIGEVLLALGETDEGFEWFERAVTEKDSALLMILSQPWYDKYRKLPGWKAIEAKVLIPREGQGQPKIVEVRPLTSLARFLGFKSLRPDSNLSGPNFRRIRLTVPKHEFGSSQTS